jgi:phage terminase large subunit GpA-like protein
MVDLTILQNPTLNRMMMTTVRRTVRRAKKNWKPVARMKIAAWAIAHRFLSSVEAERKGKYDIYLTPYLAWPGGPLDAIDDPAVTKVVGQKSAQIAWTSGVVGNALGCWIDTSPSPILMLFPKTDAAKEYMAEKFEEMVQATPRLRKKIDMRSRKAQQRQLFKRFPGGFVKLVTSRSPASVKSTPTPRVIVEEPDDCDRDLKGQGGSIELAEERVKTYSHSTVIIGGTPTIEGFSSIASAMESSDKRVAYIPCGHCGEEHVLDFANLKCNDDENQNHPKFGSKVPSTAYYVCPVNGCIWTDADKKRFVTNGRWVATAPFNGVAGFYFNELLSPFRGSKMAILMEKWLNAQYEFERGNPGPLIAFTNSSMGLPYSYKGDAPTINEVIERALDYPAGTVPDGGLVLSAGIDVQPDRLEVVIRAFGRGEESWLVEYLQLPGRPGLIEDPVWSDLDAVLFRKFRHARGFNIGITAVSLDTSDGNTSDATYKWVRSRQKKGIEFVMAIKGSSSADKVVFTRPAAVIDTTKKNTKAAKYGVQVFSVGVSIAKDLLIGEKGRVSLDGSGPGRFHVYQGLPADYYKQLLESEVKAPRLKKNGTTQKEWVKAPGKRNEVLDCEVYALHASRAAKCHTKTPAQWAALEAKLCQSGLFDEPETVIDKPAAPVSLVDVVRAVHSALKAPDPAPPAPAVTITTSAVKPSGRVANRLA